MVNWDTASVHLLQSLYQRLVNYVLIQQVRESPLLCPPFISVHSMQAGQSYQLSMNWHRIQIYSGVPLTSLFNYHWASRTQREQQSLDPGGLSSSPHLEPASKELLSWQRFIGWRHLKVTDKDFTDRWSLDLIMSICGFQPRQMHFHYPSGQWSLSVNDAVIDSRGIHHQKAPIHPIALQFFPAELPSPSTDVVLTHVHPHICGGNASVVPQPCYYDPATCTINSIANYHWLTVNNLLYIYFQGIKLPAHALVSRVINKKITE